MSGTDWSSACASVSARIGVAIAHMADEGLTRFTASYLASQIENADPSDVANVLVQLTRSEDPPLRLLCEVVCPSCSEPTGGVVPCDQIAHGDTYCQECGAEFQADDGSVLYWFGLGDSLLRQG